MSFKAIEPYTQYKTGPDDVTLAVHLGRHGTRKAHWEIGESLLKKLKWYPGDHYIDLFVGEGVDVGSARFQKGTGYKIRLMRNGRVGLIVTPAKVVGLHALRHRTLVLSSSDSTGRLFVRVPLNWED